MEKKLKYDFSGWATRNDLVCSDGRTIRRDAFAHCDGKTVPLVWNHQHDDPTNILGHALLENREDGVYAYCTFNETAAGKAAKLIVQHGDVDSLSIYANGLKQQGGNVMHGDIKELSLVVAGANPGAFIDFVDLAHGEGAEQEVIFCANEPITLAHADEGKADDSADGDKKDSGDGDTIEDVINSLTEKQKTVVVALLANAMAHSAGEPRLKKLRLLHVAVRPQVRATRQASSTNRCAVTPFRFMASLRTMKMACSKSSVSGESTTITLRDVPLTILKAAPPDGKTFCLQYARRGGRYTGRAKIFAAFRPPARRLNPRECRAPEHPRRPCRRAFPYCRPESPRRAAGDHVPPSLQAGFAAIRRLSCRPRRRRALRKSTPARA